MLKPAALLVTALASPLLSGCVAAPALKQPPVATAPTGAFVSDTLPTGPQKYTYTNLDGTYFGASGGSGSAAVGLLLGPIGVAANVAHINSVNRQRVAPLGALTSQNLAGLLKQELANAGADTATSGYKLTPAANVAFTSDTAYVLGCTITAELPAANGAKPWAARYAIHVDGQFDSRHAADTDAAIAALAPCLRSAYGVFRQHVEARPGTFETRVVTIRTVQGRTLDQKLQVATAALPGKVLVNDFQGVAELRAADVVKVQ